VKWIVGVAISAVCISVMGVLVLFFTSTDDASARVSTDLQALRNIIAFDIPAQAVTWEVFGTPEYRGGVPGPTDYLTLIAELAQVEGSAAFPSEPAGRQTVMPEAARPWLSNNSRTFLEKIKSSDTDPLTQSHCHKLQTTTKKTGAPVMGFICRDAQKTLIYLTIADFTAESDAR
jgi:hypothetical protein